MVNSKAGDSAMPRPRRIAATIVLGALLVGALPATGLGKSSGDGSIREIASRPRLLEEAVRADIRFRKALHFRAGAGYVRSLYRHPQRSVGTRAPGVLLTDEENAEFEARDALTADFEVILAAVADDQELRAAFGGISVDHETGELAVFLKPGTRTGWLASVPHPGRISVRPATLSETELLALKKTITSALEADGAGTASVTGVGIDVLGNAVRVYFDPEAISNLENGEFPAGFSSRFDTTHLVRASSPSLQAVSADKVKGGWSWGHSTSGYRCTIGFAVEKAGAPGYLDYVITAGHCVHPGEDGDEVFHNEGGSNPPEGQIAVMTTSHIFSGGVDKDVALLKIEEGVTGFTSEGRAVYETGGTGYALSVTGKVANHVDGAFRCKTGVATPGSLCGMIIDPDYEAIYGVTDENDVVIYPPRNIDHAVLINVEATKGDSGGPVFRRLNNSGNPPNTSEAAGLAVARNGLGDTAYVRIQDSLDWVSNDVGATVSLKHWAAAPGCTPLASNCQVDDGGDY